MKILWVSHSPLTNVSYGTITHDICKRIGKVHEIHVLAFEHCGRSLKGENYFIHPYENSRNFHNIINTLKPDFLVWLSDPVFVMKETLNLNLQKLKLILYFPCDGYPLLYGAKKYLEMADKIVVTSKYSQKVVKDSGFDSSVVYHGVDTNIYKPMDADKKIFSIEDDKFVFLSLGVNSLRKKLWRLIKCFNEFVKENENSVLLLRTIPDGEINLIEFTKYRFPKLFEKRKLIFSVAGVFQPAPHEFLAKIYNAADVYISTSSGEGFGVPYIESMACKKPIIAPNITTTKELILDEVNGIGPRGVGTKIDTYTTDMKWFIDRGICSIEDTVNSMKKLFENPDLRNKFGENGLKFVKKFCNWDDIAKKWLEILE